MEFLHKLHSPEGLQQLIQSGGYLLLVAIVFAETGLLVGFFLPGDSMLFMAGLVSALGFLNPAVMIPLLCVAAIAGDNTGYFIGRQAGPRLFSRQDSGLFRRKHLDQAHAFYEKHGPKTIVLARFTPIVRTFAPTVAGVGEMNFRTFFTYNVAGGIGWAASMLLMGFFLGNVPIIKNNFEKAVLGIVFISILPMVFHFIQERKHGVSPSEAAVDCITTMESDV